jgi:hypothetical protein
MLVDVERCLKFQLVRQVHHELVDIIFIFVKVILNSLSQPLVKVQWHVVVLVNSI